MKLRQLIGDMSIIEAQLINYEKKFGVRSPEFYQAITSGEPDEFDALVITGWNSSNGFL